MLSRYRKIKVDSRFSAAEDRGRYSVCGDSAAKLLSFISLYLLLSTRQAELAKDKLLKTCSGTDTAVPLHIIFRVTICSFQTDREIHERTPQDHQCQEPVRYLHYLQAEQIRYLLQQSPLQELHNLSFSSFSFCVFYCFTSEQPSCRP